MAMTTLLLNRPESKQDEIAPIQLEPISMQWTDDLRRNIHLHPGCKLLRDLLNLDLYTRAAVYLFLIKAWSPSRIADHFEVSVTTIQKLLELGRRQLKRKLKNGTTRRPSFQVTSSPGTGRGSY
jgi:hypothetical protein